MSTNKVLYFLAGAVAGAAGFAFVTSPKGKKIISDIIEGGTGIKENVTSRMETLKEDVEDYVAEKKYKRAQKKEDPAEAS